MMKQIGKYVLLMTLVSCFGKTEEKRTLPNFNIQLLDSTTLFNIRYLPPNQYTMLVFFSPDCEHCQRETENLLKNMNSFKNCQFCFISIDPLERIKVFNQYYKIYNYRNIVLGKDYTYAFLKYFKPPAPPYLILFDKQKRQKMIFQGETTASDIVKAINE